MHILIKSDQPVLYIDNRKMAELWGHGYTDTERLKGENVGRYFAAYFASLEVGEREDEAGVVYVMDEKTGKRYKKGARLHFYPRYFKFYRCSRGIVRPETEDTQYEDVTGEYGKPKETNTYAVNKPDGLGGEEHVNTIQRERYKKSRK
jgi:hypothetical protein